jgi:hypothetical protein
MISAESGGLTILSGGFERMPSNDSLGGTSMSRAGRGPWIISLSSEALAVTFVI